MKNLIRRSGLILATTAVFFVFGFNNFTNNVALAATANIDRIIFTTDQQTVAPDTISTVLTIQTQNSSGLEEKIDESSNKLFLTVDSSTGQFNSNSTTWNATSTFTMSKNTGNKNFYYKDISSGTFTINARLTSGETGKVWNTSQIITIGESGDDGGDVGTTTATTTPPIVPPVSTSTPTTTATTTSTTTVVTVYSVHYIQENLSTYTEPTNIFEISAGRPRLSYLNSPINMVAKYKTSSDINGKKCNYVWNLGDGLSLPGEKVNHIYKNIGDYNVVLNGTCGDLKSVSRTTVKVLKPNIIFTSNNNGSVEINNKGEYEINLYGWKLQAQNIVYDFPLDTIISAGKTILFPSEYLKFPVGGEVVLIDASGKTMGQTFLSTLAVDLANNGNAVSMEAVEKFAVEYEKLTQPIRRVAVVTPIIDSIQIAASSTEENVSLVATVAEVPSFGFWSKLFHPVRTIQNTFYK